MSNCVFFSGGRAIGYCTSKKNPGRKTGSGVSLSNPPPDPCLNSGKGCPIFEKEKRSKH